jgi:hypothetical protein
LSRSKPKSARDFRAHLPRFSGANLERNERLVEALRRVAAEKGATAPQLATAWVLARSAAASFTSGHTVKMGARDARNEKALARAHVTGPKARSTRDRTAAGRLPPPQRTASRGKGLRPAERRPLRVAAFLPRRALSLPQPASAGQAGAASLVASGHRRGTGCEETS